MPSLGPLLQLYTLQQPVKISKERPILAYEQDKLCLPTGHHYIYFSLALYINSSLPLKLNITSQN